MSTRRVVFAIFLLVSSLIVIGLVPQFVFASPLDGISTFGSINAQINSEVFKGIWKTMLTLVNISVVVFLLAIAFSSILHISIDTFGVRKAIFPIIIGVIMANFSLIITKTLIDFGNVISYTFIQQDKVGDVMSRIVHGLLPVTGVGIANVYELIKNSISSDTLTRFLEYIGLGLGAAGGAVITIGGILGYIAFLFALGWTAGIYTILFFILIIVVYNALPSILLLILTFLLYIRVFIIPFLVVASPLAFMSISWQPLQWIFRKWWSQFFNWIAMGPAVVFLLWVASVFIGDDPGKGFNIVPYAIAVVIVYLAIQVPFQLGGQVMAVWGGTGKKVGSFLGKSGWNLSNSLLEKSPLRTSPRSMIAGIKNHFEATGKDALAMSAAKSEGAARAVRFRSWRTGFVDKNIKDKNQRIQRVQTAHQQIADGTGATRGQDGYIGELRQTQHTAAIDHAETIRNPNQKHAYLIEVAKLIGAHPHAKREDIVKVDSAIADSINEYTTRNDTKGADSALKEYRDYKSTMQRNRNAEPSAGVDQLVKNGTNYEHVKASTGNPNVEYTDNLGESATGSLTTAEQVIQAQIDHNAVNAPPTNNHVGSEDKVEARESLRNNPNNPYKTSTSTPSGLSEEGRALMEAVTRESTTTSELVDALKGLRNDDGTIVELGHQTIRNLATQMSNRSKGSFKKLQGAIGTAILGTDSDEDILKDPTKAETVKTNIGNERIKLQSQIDDRPTRTEQTALTELIKEITLDQPSNLTSTSSHNEIFEELKKYKTRTDTEPDSDAKTAKLAVLEKILTGQDFSSVDSNAVSDVVNNITNVKSSFDTDASKTVTIENQNGQMAALNQLEMELVQIAKLNQAAATIDENTSPNLQSQAMNEFISGFTQSTTTP